MKQRIVFSSLVFLALFLAVVPTALASNTWYVDGAHGSNHNNCKSPQTACKTIGHAISLASSGDTIGIGPATYTENLTINLNLNLIGSGANTTIIDGGQINTVVTVSATVVVSNVTIQDGRAGVFGGGIYNIGTLTINKSTISRNGAGVGRLGGGGGIFNSGAVTIRNSTISGNRASCTGLPCGSQGGGIYNTGHLTISNSTISGNTSRIIGTIGGILNFGTATISNSTIAGNSWLGIGNCASNCTATLQNSVAANNSSGNCGGSITSNGYNLSSDSSCNFSNTGDLNNTDPKLGSLGNYGGPTQTIPLLSGSPAIDAGNPNGCTDGYGHLLKTDQRGMPRPDRQDKIGCDMGAYELQETHGANNFEISDNLGPFCTRGHCVYKGYCEANFVHGQWKTDGLCTSHRFNSCYIQPSKGCPVGKRIIHRTSTSCGGFGSDEVDLARPCSFIGH
jgi:hypothetical protein